MQGSALAASGKALEIFILVCRAPYPVPGNSWALWGAWLLEGTPRGGGSCLEDSNCTQGPASGLFRHPELEPPRLAAGVAKKPVKVLGRLVQKMILRRNHSASPGGQELGLLPPRGS